VRRTFKPVWTEARVKTPWVEALAQKRAEEEAAAQASSGAAKNAPKATSPTLTLDLTPRRMKDSYYRTVGIDDHLLYFCSEANSIW
jgi:acyl-coenzyme A thioesterase 9